MVLALPGRRDFLRGRNCNTRAVSVGGFKPLSLFYRRPASTKRSRVRRFALRLPNSALVGVRACVLSSHNGLEEISQKKRSNVQATGAALRTHRLSNTRVRGSCVAGRPGYMTACEDYGVWLRSHVKCTSGHPKSESDVKALKVRLCL